MAERNKYPRPGYVTFISVTLLFAGGIAMILGCMLMLYGKDDPSLRNFESPAVDQGIAAAGVLMTASATGMFLGANWGRILYYFGCVPIFLVVDLIVVTQNPLILPQLMAKLVILGIYCAALTSGRSNRYFTGRKTLFKSAGPKKYDGPEGTDIHRKDFDY